MKTLFVACAMLISTVAVFAQQNPFVGTWKMNMTKSKLAPANVKYKETSVVLTEKGGQLLAVITHVTADGRTMIERSSVPSAGGKVTLDPAPGPGEVVMTRVSATTMESVVRFQGKDMLRISDTVSPDGKMLTRTVKGTDEKGQPVDELMVLERQ